jgi:hypothetical protein
VLRVHDGGGSAPGDPIQGPELLGPTGDPNQIPCTELNEVGTHLEHPFSTVMFTGDNPDILGMHVRPSRFVEIGLWTPAGNDGRYRP